MSVPSAIIRCVAQHHQQSEIAPPTMNKEFDHIPDEDWNEAGRAIMQEIRAETGIADWTPKLLNGRRDYVERTLAKLKERGRTS